MDCSFKPLCMNILVSNLSTNVIDADLQKLFAVYGEVARVAIVRNRKNGRSKGMAYLVMPHEAQGQQAVLALHHSMLDGKEIAVQTIDYKADEFNN